MTEAFLSLKPHAGVATGVEVNTSENYIFVSINQRGVDIHIPHVSYLWRNTRRSIWSSISKVRATVYPIPLSVVLITAVGTCCYVYKAPQGAWIHHNPATVALRYLDSLNPFTKLIPPRYQATALCAKLWTIGVSAATVLHRFALRKLLTYRGWQLEPNPQKPSLITRLWSTTLSVFFTRKNIRITDVYERCLPSPPLPRLQQTVTKFLASMKVIYYQQSSLDDWMEVRQSAESFLITEGPVLQRHLRLHHALSPNYFAEWWTRNVFLAARVSLCLRSNFYTVPFAGFVPTCIPEARAAVVTYNLVQLKRKIDQRALRPPFGGFKDSVPLTMHQMLLAFNTTRIPGRELDSLDHDDSDDNNYIIVLSQGYIYQVPVRHPKTHAWLTPHQLEVIFRALRQEIEEELSTGQDESAEETDSEMPIEKLRKKRSYRAAVSLLPTLTTAPRAVWADIRSNYLLNDANNNMPLRTIEKALFVLSFSQGNSSSTATPEDALGFRCGQYLLGNGSDLWCDKSFNVVVTPDAKVGVHVEQSWCDVSSFLTLFEYIVAQEESMQQYAADGHAKHLKADKKFNARDVEGVLEPRRLHFQVRKKLAAAIREVHSTFMSDIRPELDIKVLRYDRYGKQLPKHMGVSPDSWMQMAIQLAHYQDQQGTFSQTYEAVSLRAFAQGRTEAHRSVSDASSAFVTAMCAEPTSSKEERVELLLNACRLHQTLVQEAAAGQGVDRHLFALYMISVEKQIPSEFLNTFLRKSKWKVSSLQARQRYLPDDYHTVRDRKPFETPACGFGPVSEDGYGISYCFCDDGVLYVTVTCCKSCDTTSALALSQRIASALDAMADLVGAEGGTAERGHSVPPEQLQQLAVTAKKYPFNW